jgi:hypothetical protein
MLIVLATLPSVPVDDELLVALSVGLPVGLSAAFIALVTAILGAVAGGNLLLIVLDMARAGSADDRVSAATAPDTQSAIAKPQTPTGAGMRRQRSRR